MLTRRFVLLACAGALSACQHQRRASRANVLFICQYGTVKSAMAREMTRRRAAELGVAVDVSSRGITPQNHISPALAEHLATDGIDLAPNLVQPLDAVTLARAEIVVLLDPLPNGLARADALDWTAVPSFNNTYPEAKAFLTAHIETLLASLHRPA